RLERRSVRPSERVDDSRQDSGSAPQVAVICIFDPGLADRVAGAVPLFLECFELVRRDLRHVAEDLRRERSPRICTRIGRPDLDARKVLLPLLEVTDDGLA